MLHHLCWLRHGVTTATVILAGALVLTSHAGTLLLEKIDIFEANTAGYVHYRIPGIVVTSKGTLLAYCEARKNASGDWGAIDVLMRRSIDGGKTWEPARKIVTPPAGVTKNRVALKQGLAGANEITVNNPVAIVDRKNGAVHFLYCIKSKTQAPGATPWTGPSP